MVGVSASINFVFMYSVYFIKSCRNGKIYTGMTKKDPKERLAEHNNGLNDWSRQNGSFKLVYFERYFCKKDALARENFYKSGVGRKIRNTILKTLGW